MITPALVLTLALASASALASDLVAPDFTLTTAVKGGATEVVAIPPAKHHINVQAPIELDDGGKKLKPKSAKEQRVVFKAPGSAARSFTVSLYLCDDAKTICEKHVVTSGVAATGEAPTSATKTEAKTGGKVKTDKFGFIDNAPEAALALAAKEKKPLLIDFYGIWCPPCNMLEVDVWSKPEFARATANFVKLKLDADAEVSWPLKAKYKVGGYPTVVFTTHDGDEIRRVVGSRSLPTFVAEVRKAWDARARSYEALKAKADTGDAAAADSFGLMLLERGDFEGSAKTLAATKKNQEALYAAKIGALEAKAGDDRQAEVYLVETLERAIEEFPLSPDSLERRSKLADLYEARKAPEQRKQTLLQLVNAAQEIIAKPKLLAGRDFTAADLWQMTADAQEKLENPAEAKAAWGKAAAEYRRQLTRIGQDDTERGYNLERAYCLYKSGDVAGAEKLYSTLEKKYSKEFTFYYAHGRMNLELNKTDKALPLLTSAYEYSYGDNRLRAAQLLGKAYDAAGRRTEAVELVKKTLSAATLPSDANNRTHRYVKQLKSLEQTLTAGK